MTVKELLSVCGSEEQLVCIQDTNEVVLHFGEICEYEINDNLLNKEILEIYTERYKRRNGLSGITITV